jgi:predicted enzyme related to lactoylglutathione lyase
MTMKRAGLSILSLALVAALGACGSDTKSDPTTPRVAEPAEPAEPVVADPEEPEEPEEPAEPALPPEPPPPTYLNGKWVWFELSTSDVEKAGAFYSELLGWKVEVKDMAGTQYSAIVNGGQEIGLLQALPADAKKKKLSPAWLAYISVADVDAAVAAATEAGATVTVPAMDMPEVGRFAVMIDPWGAGFGVVKSKEGDKPDGMPAAGDFIWIEHLSKDAKKTTEATAFYTKVAGYEIKTMKVGKMDYMIGNAAGMDRMGFAKADKSAWAGKFVPYIVVADVDATVKVATKLKAKVLAKPMDIPDVGRISMLSDPQGAVFAVMAVAPMAEKPAEAGAETLR